MTLLVRMFLVAIGVAAMACDRSPTAPSRPDPPIFSLRPGSYTLTIVAAPLPSAAPNPCIEATTSADRVVVPVTVEAIGKAWRIRPVGDADLGLVATVDSPSRNALVGPVDGRARDVGSGVVVTISQLQTPEGFAPIGPPSLFGSLEREDAASGIVNGQVRFSLGAGHRVCATNTWRLEPR